MLIHTSLIALLNVRMWCELQRPLGSRMSQYMRVYMVIIGLMLYACILFIIKAMFYKAHRLDQVDAMVSFIYLN